MRTSFYVVFALVMIHVDVGRAQDFSRMTVRNVRSLGMGGAAVAVAGEDNIFFYNPALLTTLRYPRFNVVDVSVRLNTNALDQYQFYRDHREEFNNIARLNNTELNDLYRQALDAAQQQAIINVEGPAPIHFLSRHFGAGIFSAGNAAYEMFEGATGIPIIDTRLRGDIQMMASLAHTFAAGPRGRAGDFSVGVTGKYLNRWITRKSKTISGFTNNESLYFYRGRSFSFDLGAFYTLNRRLQFGAAVYDIFSTSFSWNAKGATLDNPVPPAKISTSYRLGMVYRPGIRLQKWFYNFALALDFDEPFTGGNSFFKTVYMGGEFNLTPLLMVRGGFSQGYPALGAGLNLYVLRADYAFYGEEMGKFAGQLASWNHALRVQVGF
ncbi:conjugal transfer protein TraF [candidate division KSB1 bacterium]|nr:conjugal transfer protein TraF [candidate division KSB1 bacterium]